MIIRADASRQIGIGHIMRCLAIAQAWQDNGGEVTFLSYCESDPLRHSIISEGFGFVSIERLISAQDDLEKLIDLLQDVQRSAGAPALVLDGYRFSPDYLKSIRKSGFRLLVIDDYNHQQCYHADILLNQNLGAENYQYEHDSDTQLLLGSKYALLRREFLEPKEQKREIPRVARRILATLGGADPDNVMLKVVQALKLVYLEDLSVRIVAGPAFPNSKKLEKEIQCNSNSAATFEIARNCNMCDLMIWADLAVSAGGSTCWELAFMGVPNVILIMAENQEEIGKSLHNQGAAINLGWENSLTVPDIAIAIKDLCHDFEQRKEISRKGQALIDGKGVQRVVKIMQGA